MDLPLNYFSLILAQASATASPTSLSEAELLARHPLVAAVGALLFSIGLLCDVYLLFCFAQRKRSADNSGNPILNVQSKPWGVQELVLATAAMLMVFIVGNGVFAIIAKLARVDDTAAIPWLLFGELVLRIGVLAGLAGYFYKRNIDTLHVLGLRLRGSARAIGAGAVFYLAILPPLGVVFAIYTIFCRAVGIEATPQPVADLLATTDSALVIVLLVGFAIVVAPLFEEVFFRGFAYPALKQQWGWQKALLAVSAAFALIHFHLPSAAPLFALGVGLALAYEFTGSLLTPIVMHSLFNATNVVVLMYVRAHG